MYREPEKIMVAGDWHGNGTWGQRAIWHGHKNGADTIVHVGDFGWWLDTNDTYRYLRFLHQQLEETDMILYWVDGNHEDHSRIVKGDTSHPDFPRIVYLPRGTRWTWWGKEWLALGGAHSVDRHLRTEGRSWWPEERITDEQAQNAIAGGPVDVMVTHDCPAGVAIPGIHADEKLDALRSSWPLDAIQASNTHRRLLRTVADAVRPKLLLHGHYHIRYQDVLRYDDGTVTLVQGLAEDGSSLDHNVLFLNKPVEDDLEPS